MTGERGDWTQVLQEGDSLFDLDLRPIKKHLDQIQLNIVNGLSDSVKIKIKDYSVLYTNLTF